ncbi:hypothetical protein G7Z17_g11722 [Cylindrodendrum hubeiense]|uniref:UBC core domain-containing protein n=1 Tax=Cylindrodendrum hubeiense TaxID=595255 RepID=A0A9P5H0G8_9HYPO|nr:hypothetical protein G7Z17_g11722 [Cylindrodendrum hubeiense]
MPRSTASGASSSSKSATKRLIKELDTWRVESKDETGVERLGPVDDADLLEWQAVINGQGVGSGYDDGRWLVNITIPPTYPLAPPKMSFVTPIVHPNIALETGEICLDLLKDAWTPAYSILECVRAVRMLLSCPETDSPLNVDVAALLRGGDVLGTRKLVEFWIHDSEGRYNGP